MTKQTWQKEGKYPCELCGKGFAQTYGENRGGRFVRGCFTCVYQQSKK